MWGTTEEWQVQENLKAMPSTEIYELQSQLVLKANTYTTSLGTATATAPSLHPFSCKSSIAPNRSPYMYIQAQLHH